jgi:hypothetical protein
MKEVLPIVNRIAAKLTRVKNPDAFLGRIESLVDIACGDPIDAAKANRMLGDLVQQFGRGRTQVFIDQKSNRPAPSGPTLGEHFEARSF